jgi:hypothetical protein
MTTIFSFTPTAAQTQSNHPDYPIQIVAYNGAVQPVLNADSNIKFMNNIANQFSGIHWQATMGPRFILEWEAYISPSGWGRGDGYHCIFYRSALMVGAENDGYPYGTNAIKLVFNYYYWPSNGNYGRFALITKANGAGLVQQSYSNIPVNAGIPELNSGTWRRFKVEYNYGKILAYVDDTRVFTSNVLNDELTSHFHNTTAFSNTFFGFTGWTGAGSFADVYLRNIKLTTFAAWNPNKTYMMNDTAFLNSNAYTLLGKPTQMGGLSPAARTTLPSTGGWVKTIPRASLRSTLIDGELWQHPDFKTINVHSITASSDITPYSLYDNSRTYNYLDTVIHNGYFHVLNTTSSIGVAPTNSSNGFIFPTSNTSSWLTQYQVIATNTSNIITGSTYFLYQSGLYRASSNVTFRDSNQESRYLPESNALLQLQSTMPIILPGGSGIQYSNNLYFSPALNTYTPISTNSVSNLNTLIPYYLDTVSYSTNNLVYSSNTGLIYMANSDLVSGAGIPRPDLDSNNWYWTKWSVSTSSTQISQLQSTSASVLSTNGFKPSEISGMMNWYAANTLITSSSNLVSQWNDLSGNVRHATQGSQSNQPAFSQTGLNNKPTINSSASNYLITTSSNLTSITFAMVTSCDNNTQGQVPIAFGTLGPHGSNYYHLARLNTNNQLYVAIQFVGYYSTYNPPANQPIVLIGTSTLSAGSGTVQMFVNGTNVYTETLSAAATMFRLDNMNLGGWTEDFGRSWRGNISEFMIFNKVLDTFERQKLEGYLRWKWWGNGTALPITHPYYSFPTPSTNSLFSPLNLFGVTNWWTAEKGIIQYTASNIAYVSQWNDQSGNNRHLTTSNISDYPFILNSALNSRPTVSFGNATTRILSGSAGENRTAFSVAMVAYTTTGIDHWFTTSGPWATGSFHGNLYSSNRLNAAFFGGNHSNNSVLTSNGPFLAVNTNCLSTRNSLTYFNSYVYTNGILNGFDPWMFQTTASTISLNAINVGNWFNGSTSSQRSWNGGISEMIIFDHVLSKNERLKLEGYMAWKWWNKGSDILPVDHQYYNKAP